MAKLTFMGGIHPYDGKDLSKDKPMKAVLPKGDLVYPLSQHIGAPAVPVVAKGDHVLTGQKIAEAQGFVSAPIYATVSGTVKAMGGAGFPTHVKLSPKKPDSITDVIVNCAECEPYLTSDYRRMVEEPEKLIAGLKVMLKLFPNAKGTLAVEDNKPDAIALLKKLTKDETDISVSALHTKYPQGSERHLIYAVTGRAINSSMLPADAGCIVDNVDTVVAINQAVREGKPLMHRIVTVTGDAVANPQNFIVRIGTNYNELIEEAGGFVQEPAKIISGGPMMGFGIFDLNVPTTKTSSALLCLTHDDVADSQPSACINCGRCVEVCPGRVVPKLLADYAERHDLERFEACNGLECCECGCCSYVCPAKRPLTQAIKSARKMVLAEKKKKQQEAKK